MQAERVQLADGLPPDDQLFGANGAEIDVYAGQGFTPADALAPRLRPPPLVAGLLQPGGLYMPYSSPGQLKTMLVLDLAMSVAVGRPWLPSPGGSGGFAVAQTPVLWVDQDNGRDVMLDRIEALTRAYGVTDAPLECQSFPEPSVAASRSLTLLTKHALALRAGLVVFDNLLRVAAVRDENAAEIDVAMGRLRLFAEETGAAVVVIHHRRKDTLGRDGDSIRGHSSIEAALDGAYLVTRDEGSDLVTVKCTKARRKPAATFAARWSFEATPDGEGLHTARFWGAAVRDKRAEAAAALQADVLAALAAGPLNTSRIVAEVGHQKTDVLAALRALHTARQVLVEIGARNARIYRLAR